MTGLVSLDRAADARTSCGADTKACDPAATADIDSARTYGWISTVSFALALAGGGLATYAFLSNKEPSAKSGPRVDVVMLPAGAGLTGRF